MEVPNEVRAHPNEAVIVLLRGDGLKVRSRIARRNAVEQLALAEKVHRVRRLAVNAVTAAGIGRFLKALERDGRDKVLHAQHVVGELFVDERAVRKGEEDAVVVLFAELDEIRLADERFAAGVNVHVNAHVLALTDDVIDLVKGEIELVAVFRSPAAGTVEVASGGRVHQDGPRDIAAVLLAVLDLLGIAQQTGIHDEVLKQGPAYSIVNVRPEALDQLIPIALRVFNHLAKLFPRGPVDIFRVQLVRPINQFGKIAVRVLIQVAIHHGHARLFELIHPTHTAITPSLSTRKLSLSVWY